MATRTDIVTDGHVINSLPCRLSATKRLITSPQGVVKKPLRARRSGSPTRAALLHSRLVRPRSQFTLYAC
jgi:hypothetical protein